MTDDATIVQEDQDDAESLLMPGCDIDFEIQCKQEPCTDSSNLVDEVDPLAFDEATTSQFPIFTPTIKHPVILLERCDKIWETLQLIKTTQSEQPADAATDDYEDKQKKEEKMVQHLDAVKPSTSYIKNPHNLRNDNKIPFKFSVKITKKVYPCTTCGKHYLERRSLRKHSEKIHGIIIPLQRRRKRRTTNNKGDFNENNSFASTRIVSKEDSFENIYNNEDTYERLTTKLKLPNTEITSQSALQFVKCTLCQQKVISLRKHLINYHKIGGSSNVMKQLESSLLSKTEMSPEYEETMPKNELHQDGCLIMDNENDAHGTSYVKRKRKYKSSYGNTEKKRKLNNKRHIFIQTQSVTQKQIFKVRSYKCDICLGMYSSPRCLRKHKRVHAMRGETKENFHKVKCRYFNSPFNEKNRLLKSSTSANINVKDTSKVNKNLQDDQDETFKMNRATRYSKRMNKNNETVCICGRSFRNPHTLFVHKKNCELCQNEDKTAQSSDKDSGIDINITIKKRNDSYEIVGKDNEDTSQKSDNLTEETLSMSNTSNYTKNVTKMLAKQQVLDTSESSKYSKDHSILKLEDADEDMIIDIEDDVQMDLDNNSATKQMVMQKNDKEDLLKQQNDETKDEKIEKIFGKVSTLKEMCQQVLDVSKKCKFENAVENKNMQYNQIKDQEICKENRQVKNQKDHQENKRELRSTNKQRYSTVKFDHCYDGTTCTTELNSLVCGYCNEKFISVKSYDNHQCTVKVGKPFNEFSLQLPCFYCKAVISSFNKYDDHIRYEHFDNAYHCYQCPQKFVSDKARLNHYHLEHELLCRFCDKRITMSVKTLHESYHLGFGYPCHKCKKAYSNNKNLCYHRYTIHPKGADNMINCSICLKPVKLKTFRGHMSTHKHNGCHFCGKVFSNRIGLEYHTMIHHGTNSKFKCNNCSICFLSEKQLQKHKIGRCSNGIQKMKKKTYSRID
ncbi:hypothetical protein P5V15_001910 [Pogonomyrmex californicus]